MKIDYAKTIQYIRENFDDLKFTNEDLKKINDLLEYLRRETEMEIISGVVLNDPSVRTQIEEARKRLEERRTFLSEQKDSLDEQSQYKEFVPRESVDGVSPAIQATVSDADKKRYDAEKSRWEREEKPKIEKEIKTLSDMIDRLDGCIQSLDNPEKFIKEFLYKQLDQEISAQAFQKLVNHCATTMASGYMEMEAMPGVGELFSKRKDVSSNFDGYEINIDAVTKFLSLVRDPEMLEEASQYYDAYSDYWNAQRRLSEAQREKTKYEGELEAKKAKREFLQDEELVADLEGLIGTIADRVKSTTQLDGELRKLDLPVSTNFFTKIFAQIRNRLFPNTAVESQRAELMGKKAKNRQDITTALSSISGKAIENEAFSQLYAMYHDVGLDLMGNPGYGYNSIIQAHGRDIAKLIALVQHSKGGTIHTLVESELGIGEESIKKLEALVASRGKRIEELQADVKDKKGLAIGAFEKLSPEVKAYHAVKEGEPPAAIGPVRYWKDKYVEVREPKKHERYNATPFVSSLIMEALVKVGKENGLEIMDASKVSPEIIAEYRTRGEELATQLKGYVDKGSKSIGSKLAAKYGQASDGQDVEDGRDEM